MQKKRIAALFTAVAVAASALLAGCGANAEKEQESVVKQESEKEESKSSEAVEEEELEPVTLTYWMAGDKTEDTDLVMDAVNEYLANVLPNTTLEIVYVSLSEWADRWSKAMASQEPIDIAWFGWMNKMNDEVSMGSLMPIDDLVSQYGQGITETLGQEVLDIHRALDGNMYFLPAWQGLVGGRYGFYLPQENVELMGDGWAEEFQKVLYENCTIPAWDTEGKMVAVNYIEEYLKASKDAGKLGYGLNVNGSLVSWIWRVNSLGQTCNIELCVDGDTMYLEAPSSETYIDREIVRVLHDFYEKGYIREDVASAESKGTTYALDTKDANYITHCAGALLDDADVTASVNAGYDIDVFHLTPAATTGTGFATGTVIPATAENPERAMMLLDLIYTDPTLYQMIVYGIEGTHYTKNSDGTITKPENSTYTGPENWKLGTCMNSLQTDASQLDYYPRLKALEEKSDTSVLLGFSFNTEPVSVEVANITAIRSEYQMASLITMDNWEEVMDEMSEKLIAAGMEKVIKEFYNQLLPFAEEKGYKVEIKGF